MEDKEVNTVEETRVEETKPDNQDFDNNSCFSMCKCASCISACNSEGKKCLRHGSQDMINKDNKDNNIEEESLSAMNSNTHKEKKSKFKNIKKFFRKIEYPFCGIFCCIWLQYKIKKT